MKQDLDLSGNRLNYINAACKEHSLFLLSPMNERQLDRYANPACYPDEVGYVVFQIPSNMVLIKYP